MRIRGFVALLISLTAVNLAVPASVSAQTGASTPEWQIITNYRKLIVLAAVEDADNEDDVQLTNVVGKIIFHENRRTLANLEEVIYTELTQPNSAAEAGTRFVELLSATKDIWDADKLAFLGMVESLLARLENVPVSGELKRLIVLQLKGDVNTLKRVQARYNDELGKVIARFSSRAMQDRRQAWDEYLNYISALHSKTAILADYQDQPLLPASRGAKAKTAKPAKKSPEMFGYGLPAKTLVLTFDDGPHHSYSEKIMAIMAKYNIKPIFFHVGENLGKVDKSGKVKLSRSAEISKKLLKSGAVLANHSYTHSVLPKLSQDEVSTEINTTNSIIENITGEKTILFRPPYGARNESMLAWIKASHLSSIMWNIDSKDWADPVPKSIAQRVVDEVEKKKKGIILFHDIQPQTVEALPLLLDELVSRGYQFAEWDGKAFSVANVKKPAAPVVKTGLYRESWAVVIGVDKYTHWPKLRYAVNDAKGIKEVLVNKFGFKTENIFTLYDEQATRDNILSLFHDKLGDSGLVQKEDRVMIFYAGHGATRKLHSGRELGYIIPVDADNKNYFGQSISMTNISDISEAIPAKHLFFVMDSCYSGMALTRGGGGQSRSYNFIQENNKRTARQMLTAGGADQEVADGGPNGHSVFTWSLIQALNGKADMNKDNYITASELAAYISPIVSSISLQTPAFGNLLGSQGGDFVFALETEPQFLSELSEQLDEQEMSLSKKLESMKREIEQKRERNIKLKKELQSVKAMLERMEQDGKKPAAGQTAGPVQLNDEGLQLYREKNYAAALEKFTLSANADPTYTEAVNNTGFVYYKMGKFSEAAVWLEKTVALDSNRAVAWFNLADAYFALGRHKEAEQAYRKHLELAPDSRVKARVLEKLAKIKAGS